MDTKEDISNINFNDQKVALFIGSEESGLSNEIQKKLDIVSKINMNNKMESLNASVAAGIAMNHFFKKISNVIYIESLNRVDSFMVKINV